MLGYGSIFRGCGAGVGFAAGLGVFCGVEPMSSVYGDGGREASDLQHDSAEAGDEVALQGSYAVAVGDTSLAVRFGDPHKVDLRSLAVSKYRVVELLGVHAEAEVPCRQQHKDGSDKRGDRTDDGKATTHGRNRLAS